LDHGDNLDYCYALDFLYLVEGVTTLKKIEVLLPLRFHDPTLDPLLESFAVCAASIGFRVEGKLAKGEPGLELEAKKNKA
jgi:hypothetical protein